MSNCGIYKITNIINGKIYIGKSIKLKTRLSKHKTELNGNYHINKHLQNAFNKYESRAFTFEIIIYCDESLLDEYEKDLIYLSESYKPSIGYNLTMGGDGQRPNEETKFKMSGSNNHFFGKKHSKETKLKMSLLKIGKEPSNKFSDKIQQSIVDNYLTLHISQRDLAKILCISQGALRKTLLKRKVLSIENK